MENSFIKKIIPLRRRGGLAELPDRFLGGCLLRTRCKGFVTASCRFPAAFSLFELAIVFVVMGLISVIAARAIPTLNQQNTAIELGAELRGYTESVLGRAEAERMFISPDNFTSFPHYDNYSDSTGNRWGYAVTRDMISKNGLCALDPGQKIAIIYCKGDLASCNNVQQIQSFVEDVAFVMFSSSPSFKSRVKFYTKDVGITGENYAMDAVQAVSANNANVLTASNFSSYNAIIMKIAAPSSSDPVDDTVLDYTYQEVWDRVDCPPLRSVTEGDVLGTRGAHYAYVDMIYDFVPIPLNFLDTQGAEYCFESYEGLTTDFGLAKTYERDYWDGAESNYLSSDTGSGAGGGVSTSGVAFNSSNSNYCNRANNRMPTVNSCSGSRMQLNWLNSGIDFPKWYKDENRKVYWVNSAGNEITNKSALTTVGSSSGMINSTDYPYGYMKWFFCGGNGAWDRLDVGGTQALEDYQIRLRPGYRGSDLSNYYRINNRSFKAYARIPGSRAIYKQAFTMIVRGTTYFYEYGWPVD